MEVVGEDGLVESGVKGGRKSRRGCARYGRTDRRKRRGTEDGTERSEGGAEGE